MAGVKNEIGNVYGRLTVVCQRASEKKSGFTRAMWECKCACGKTIITDGASLRNGHKKSCGCLYDDTRSSAMKLGLVEMRRGINASWNNMNRAEKVKRLIYSDDLVDD